MKQYNENDKVRGESGYFDDDAIFQITGQQIKLIGALSREQGGSVLNANAIREILRAVIDKAATPNDREVSSCISCPLSGELCPHSKERITDTERYKKCRVVKKTQTPAASKLIVAS